MAVRTFRRFGRRPVRLGGYPSPAGYTTSMTGTNNDLSFESKARGAWTNNIRVRIVVSGNNTSESVSVSGLDITINSSTDGGGAATSTGDTVKAAIAASTPANALVSVADATGNDGSGVVAALAYTALSGGRNYVIGQ